MDTFVVLTITLVAIAALSRVAKSWAMFAGGVVGTVIGLFLAPAVPWNWGAAGTMLDGTNLGTFVGPVLFGLNGTVPFATVGLIVGWRIGHHDPTLPSDDARRR